MLAPEDFNVRLELELPDAFSPKETDLFYDLRVLALQVHQIRISA